MRIAELSRQAGVPVPTIKYYLREGLLAPGEFSSPNQASYDASHIKRLHLIRTLLEIGRLPIASIKEILPELDNPDPDLHHVLGRALMNVSGPREPAPDEIMAAAQHETDALMERMGWRVSPYAAAQQAVADVIAALHRLGATEMLARLDQYAAAVETIARLDLDTLSSSASPDEVVYGAVVGTILGDSLLAGMRRLAQESISAKAYGLRPKSTECDPPG